MGGRVSVVGTALDDEVKSAGIEFPGDLKEGSYSWRSYAYANLFKGQPLNTVGKSILVRLFKTLLEQHRIPWVRREMIPLEPGCALHVHEVLRESIFNTDSADVFRVILWQRSALQDGRMYTDDHVVALVPKLDRYRRKV